MRVVTCRKGKPRASELRILRAELRLGSTIWQHLARTSHEDSVFLRLIGKVGWVIEGQSIAGPMVAVSLLEMQSQLDAEAQ